jgi:hypothetical protein
VSNVVDVDDELFLADELLLHDEDGEPVGMSIINVLLLRKFDENKKLNK